MNNLSPKQKKFVEFYLDCLNATKAAILAGYSKKSAYSIGHENLRKHEVQFYMRQLINDQNVNLEVLKKRVVEELIRLGINFDEETSANKLKALELLGKASGLFDRQSPDNTLNSNKEWLEPFKRRLDDYINKRDLKKQNQT